VLQRVAACCSVLQRIAVCCSVLQRVAALVAVMKKYVDELSVGRCGAEHDVFTRVT